MGARAFLLSALLGIVLSGAASAGTLTFDDGQFTEGENLRGAVKTVAGVDFTIWGRSADGIGGPTIFDTMCNGINNSGGYGKVCTGNDTDLSSPFPDSDGGAPLIAHNALIINEAADPMSGNGPNDDPSGGRITFVFDKMVRLLGFDLLDLGDGNEDKGLTVKVDGHYLISGATVAGNGFFRSFDLGDTPFGTTFHFFYKGSGAIDNIQFAAQVPVPASLPILLTGLGALGLVRRRARRKAA